jgi:hypothetical protein
MIPGFTHSHRIRLVTVTAAAFVAAMTSLASAQQSFSSADEAADALAKAAKSGDRNAILTVLGKDGADIVSSGDEVADAAAREKFVSSYDVKHQVALDGDSKATMVIGQDDFPFPIPLVRRDGKWQFDAAAGRQEILARRVGRNELDAIKTVLAIVDAQQDYADKGVGGPGVYAQRIVSRDGKKDGLYWPAKAGEDESPLGELAAAASAQGYRAGKERRPYHGYYFKILTRQGDRAPGGAMDYVARGKMIGGFALVAWPAEYGNSGVTTFLVNHQGNVYQKDLGPETAKTASRMTSFNPDTTWQRVDEDGKVQSGDPARSQ